MLAHRIKQIRLQKKMTQSELAKKINRTTTTIQRYESGEIKNIKNDVIAKLAEALEVTPEFLMGWSNIKNPDINTAPIVKKVTNHELISTKHRSVLNSQTYNNDVFFVRLEDDSMSPKIPKGAYALINPLQTYKQGDYVCAVTCDSSVPIIRVYSQSNGHTLLTPLNVEDKFYIVDGQQDITILGRVIEVSYKL